MNRRLIGLAVAVVLAGVATFVLYQVVTTAEERAREQEELAEVFVAQEDIPAGTSASDAIAQGLVDRDEIPVRTVPDDAIGDLDQIAGQVAVAPIYAGEVIVLPRFGDTVAQAQAAFDVPEGMHAVTVEAGVIDGLAGFIQPRDIVSVVASLEAEAEEEEAPPPPPDDEDEVDAAPAPGVVSEGFRTQFLIQNATVLAVGQRVVNLEDGSQPPSVQLSNDRYIFTLAMPPEDIEQLVFASQQGEVWFTLLPPLEDGEEPESIVTPGRTIGNLFD